ncbi:sigma-54 interaction domain-containing protein [Desulfosporosinus fructosivorans]
MSGGLVIPSKKRKISQNINNYENLKEEPLNCRSNEMKDDQDQSLRTQLEEMQKDLEYYRNREFQVITMGNTILDGVLMVDPQGIILEINKVFSEWIERGEKEIVGKHCDYLSQFLDKEICSRDMKKQNNITRMVTLLNNGKRVLLTEAPFFDMSGKFIHVVVVMRDMTELSKLKEELEIAENQRQRFYGEIEYLKKRAFDLESESVGKSIAMLRLKETISEIAKTDVTVLITGETGVGKELVAKEIYKNSLRKEKPYIKVNCAAIPDNLLESELFGHEKGAFTGASNKEKLGLFELANSGTILLDEIGELPLPLQSKLLRVLQEKELRRVGGVKCIKLDVRVIASTNQNLEQLISQGKFRKDLFYRLNVVPVNVPPLRTRKGDIPLLVNVFTQKYTQKYNKHKVFERTAVSAFEHYDWPGNVRELENYVERLIIFGENNLIREDDVAKTIRKSSNANLVPDNNKKLSLKEMVHLYEKQIIGEVLANCGSTHKAAKILGVSQPTVLNKAKMLGIR